MTLYLYPLIPGVIFGTLNWFYWRRRGFTSSTQLIMGILIFYAGSFFVYRYFTT